MAKITKKHGVMPEVLGEPDPFRLRHRGHLQAVIGHIVRAAMAFIQTQLGDVAASERPRFVEVAETERMSLHEGNFARYRMRPSQFEAWQRNWR